MHIVSGARRSAPAPSLALPRFDFGFLCVVILPAMFWASVAFLVMRAEGGTLAPQISIFVFTAAAVFLNFICTALKVRN